MNGERQTDKKKDRHGATQKYTKIDRTTNRPKKGENNTNNRQTTIKTRKQKERNTQRKNVQKTERQTAGPQEQKTKRKKYGKKVEKNERTQERRN